MTQEHLLIVEDEQDIAEILHDYLVREGYRVTVKHQGDGVVDFVKNNRLSVILLDIMIPGMDGKTICREVRTFSDIPILMITAKVEEIDRLIGFELGADDYICKPFSPREIVARVKAILRRIPDTSSSAGFESKKEKHLSAGPFELDKACRVASIKGVELQLTPSEFGILAVLMKRPGRVFSREQLIEITQGYTHEGYSRTIDFHIKNLRKKIAEQLPKQKIIQASYGAGYKLVLPK
ncbi:response regulator [Desulfovibrio sp. JC022]|uniref:response regulator n=1 Tax=Desulfovibrio sp. JC022 TaxID=2593642 RepID=UPI0013D732E3|nr:response regulator [Desulfovibrio sp. JC022]NDV22921.1 response regulator [Desulfovibrio sp. JC022]